MKRPIPRRRPHRTVSNRLGHSAVRRRLLIEPMEQRRLLAIVAHYSLDGDLLDDSPSGNDGTFQGAGGANTSATFVAEPRFGNVLSFDGTDDRVDLGSLFTLQNNSWSVSMWAQTDATSNTVPLLGKNSGDTGFSAGERVFEITGDQTWGNIINPEPAGNFAVNGHSMGGAVTNQSAMSLDDGTWHMLTAVHDNSVSATDMTLYIDGVAQTLGSQTFNNNDRADVGNFYLGFSNFSNNGGGYFSGQMAEVNFYDSAIDQAAVTALFEAHPEPAQPFTIGPGADLAGATIADTADQERLNVARTDTLTLAAGTYDVVDFQLNVLNADTGTGNAGTVTPMLLTGPPSSYTTLWVGDAFDPTSTGQQTAATYTPGDETFTLATAGEVFGGIFTGNNGSAIAALANGVGSTDHDGNGFTAPTAAGQTVDGFSHPGLGRTYAFEINIDADPGDVIVPPQVTTTDGDSAAVGTDLLETNFGGVIASGFGAIGGTDPVGLEPVVRDGTATGTAGYADGSTTTVVVANGAVVTYTLDTSVNTAGYQIDQIDIFHGWRDDGRDEIADIDVAYATVAAPTTFINFLTGGNSGDYAADFGRTSVVPGGAATFLATDVAAVRITFDSIQNSYGGISEIDVLGSAASPITYHPITGDVDSEISSSKVYTHAIDFGNQTATFPVATINGVVFGNGSPGAFPDPTGTSQTVGAGSSTLPMSHNGGEAGNIPISGQEINDLLGDMIYNDTTGEITLTGLTPGAEYQFRLYNRRWTDFDRSQAIGFDTDGVGLGGIAGAEHTGVFNPDRADEPDPSLATGNQVFALTYDYTLSPGVDTLTVYINATGGGSYHLYGLTNEEVNAADTPITYHPITGDADSGISADNTYTHALDFGTGSPGALINGVQFDAYNNAADGTLDFSRSVSSASENDHGGNGNHNVTGELVNLMTDMYFNGNNDPAGTTTWTLSGLTAGTTYDTRIYVRQWGANPNRTATLVFDPDGAGPISDSTANINEDDATTVGMAAANTAYYINYQFTAVAGEDLVITVAQDNLNNSWHLYGLTNEEVGAAPTLDAVDDGYGPITLSNGDFEADAYAVWPGYASDNGGSITGWNHIGGAGINPVTGGDAPFRDNGDNSTQVAFIQGAGSLSQTISAFTIGAMYELAFDYNERATNGGGTTVTATIAGETFTDPNNDPVGGANPYHTASLVFAATATSETLTLSSASNGGDQTSLFDNIVIRELITEDQTLTIPAAAGVLANDTPTDANIAAFDSTSAEGAAVTVSPDGSFTYDPTGSATIQALNDGDTLTDTFTYTITDATVLYAEDFAAGGGLNGTSPDTAPGGETWIASDLWGADGTKTTNGGANALLPFTPVAGEVYTLSLTANPDISGSDDWFSLGFSETANVTNWHTSNTIHGWMLNRENDASSSTIQTFAGPGTGSAASHDLTPDVVGPIDLQVVLDTTAANWTVEWFAEGNSLRGPVPFGANPTNIQYVGFGAWNTATGSVDNFSLIQSDSSTGTDTATVSIIVHGVNDAPDLVAVDDTASVSEDSTGITIDVLANDGGADALIPGVTIEDFSSELVTGFDRQADFTVDGSGLTAGQHGTTPDGSMWLSNGTFSGGTDPLPAHITFDLGDNYNLDNFHVWNYNEATGGLSTRGANDVEISVADSVGGPFTSLGNFNFAQATGLATYTGEDIDLSTLAAANDARLVRFDINSSHGGDNNFAGLSEVQFFGSSVPIAAVTPNTDLGGGGLFDLGGSVTNNVSDVTYSPNGQFESLAAGETATDTFAYTVTGGAVVATPAVILSTDFSGRTVGGDTASNITWTTSGVSDPGDLTAAEEDGDANDELAGLFDTPNAQEHFAPNLNTGNEGPWSTSLTLNLTVPEISLENVVLDYQHFNNSGVFQGVNRLVNWTVTVTGSVSGQLDSVQVNGSSSMSGTETIVFGTPLMLTSSESYDVTILAEGGDGTGNNTGLDGLTLNGAIISAETDTATVTVTVTGVNDAPVIDSAAQSGTIAESADSAPASDADPADATGTTTFDDVDLSDNPTASVLGGASVTGGTASLTPAQQTALLDNLSLSAVTDNADGSGSVDWTYDVGNSEIDFLGASDSVELTFTVEIDDGNGGADTQDVVITVNGANDAPVITEGAGPLSVTMDEDGSPTAFATPTIGATDVDASNTLTWSLAAGGSASNGTASVAGTGASPAITYSPTANFNGSDGFTVQVSDGTSTDTIQVGVTINQINDAATFSGDTSGAGPENGPAITGALTATDTVDGMTTPNYTVAVDGASGAATIDATTGLWSYTPDPDTNGGDSFTVQVTDDDGNNETQVITVTVDPAPTDPVYLDGDGNVVVVGTDLAERIIIQAAGRSRVFVRYNDTRYGGFEVSPTSTVIVFGAGGHDRISVSSCISTEMHGEEGNDSLYGGKCNDAIFGGPGKDTILVGEGDNLADGGSGNDRIAGRSGDDELSGGAGNDVLTGGAGQDILRGDAGNDLVVGGNGNDLLVGGPGNDTMYGQRGEDVVVGGDGNDLLRGGPDADLVVGGIGLDRLQGERGGDVLAGGDALYEADDAALLAVLASWTSSRDRSPLGTLADDGERDAANGGGGADEFHVGVDDDVYQVRTNDLLFYL